MHAIDPQPVIPATSPAAVAAKPLPRGLLWQAPLLGLSLLAIYLANGREIGSYDTIPTALTAYTLARGGTIDLAQFEPLLREPDGRRSPYVTERSGWLISRYPVWPAVMAAPLFALEIGWLDQRRPGWDRNPAVAWSFTQHMGKHAAAVMGALTGMVLWLWLIRLVPRGDALIGTLAALLASDLWTVASQALWQHGPGALCLVLAGLLLEPGGRRPGLGQIALAGLAAAGMVAARASNLPFALALSLYLLVRRPGALAGFLPTLTLGGLSLLAFNFWFFDQLTGGLAALEAMHPWLHDKPAGFFSGDVLEGALGTLFSPARGLLVYSPWVVVALTLLPWAAQRLRSDSPAPWLLGALPVVGLVLARYPVWWAGHTFGPRYWCEAMTLLGLLLAVGLAGLPRGMLRRLVGLMLMLTIVWSILLQLYGAALYPSSWNLAPRDVDRAHERLWQWRDTEIQRGVTEWLQQPPHDAR